VIGKQCKTARGDAHAPRCRGMKVRKRFVLEILE